MNYRLAPILFLFSITSLAGQTALDTSKIRAHIKAAQQLFESFDYQSAKAEAQLAVKAFSETPDTAFQLRGDALRVMGGIQTSLRQADSARFYLNKAIGVYESLEPINYEFIAQINSNIGISYIKGRENDYNDFSAAIPWFQRAADAMQKSDLPNKNIKTMDYLGNIGLAHFYLNQFELAEKKYLEALSFQETPTPEDRPYIGMMEARLGFLYQRKGNLSGAIQLFETALENYQSAIPEHPFVANIMFGLSNTYRARGDYEKALLYAEQARVMFLKLIGPNNEEYVTALNAKADALEALGRLNEVNSCDSLIEIILNNIYPNQTPLKLINQATRIERFAQKTNNPNLKIEGYTGILDNLKQLDQPVEEEIAQITMNLGSTYQETGDFEKAEELFLESLVLHQALYPAYSGEMIYINAKLANLNQEMGKTEAVLDYFEAAEQSAGLTEALNVNTLAYPIFTAKTIRQKGQFFSQQYPEKNERADSLFQVAQLLLEQIQNSAQGQNSKVGLQDEMVPVLEGRLSLLDSNEVDISKAFQIIERGKSFILLQAVQQSRVEQFTQIPAQVLKQERTLKENIAFYEKELYLLKQKEGYNLEKEEDWTKLLAAFKNKADSLEGVIAQQYPKYHQLKYQPEFITLKGLQKQLSSDQSVLDYFVGEKHIYCLKIERASATFQKLALDYPLTQWVEELRSGLTDPKNDRWKLPAQQLFEKLIASLGPLQENLIIIPQGVLSYIPFEVLLSTAPEENSPLKDWDFLVKKHAISYNFSGTLLRRMQEMSIKKKGLLAFAPSFNAPGALVASRRDYLGPLIFNQQEVDNIGQLYPGKILKDTAASLSQFMANTDQYSLLHLATHAKLEDQQSDYSYLAFYGVQDSSQAAKLFIRDLYNMNLPLDMVVLSACETGIGTLKNGEGLMSLARGFAYAGAKSVVTSLWAANDLTTAQIMTNYYKNLKEGLSKDIALQQAKLQFLAENQEVHPYYWATFVGFGDMKAIKESSFSWFPYLIGFLGLLILGFPFVKGRNTK